MQIIDKSSKWPKINKILDQNQSFFSPIRHPKQKRGQAQPTDFQTEFQPQRADTF